MRSLVSRHILEQHAKGERAGDFQASVLFVDISGFTTTTNTLMEFGQEGGEAMADVMRSIFDPLIAAVFEHGGFVGTLAGDGMTSIFPETGEGGSSSLRALAAATLMQKQLAANPTRSIDYGDFSFTIRLGMAFGDVQWRIIERPQPPVYDSLAQFVYYFCGSAIDTSAGAQNLAGANELVVSHSTYERLRSYVAAEATNGYWRISTAYRSLQDSLPPPRPLEEALTNPEVMAGFVPATVLNRAVHGEYRQVCTLFINLEGSPGHDELASFVQTIFELQEQHGGFLSTIDFGDKGCTLLLFWGMPVTYEDDVQRALEFAQDLMEKSAIPFRAGVTYRHMYAGFVGSSLRQEYSCYGMGVNLAARLMAAAPWGAIWLDEHTAQRGGQHFELSPLGELSLHGFGEPQSAYHLLGPRGVRPPRFRGRMVGREAEMVQLSAFVLPLWSGHFAGTLLIRGEMGIGKSRLVDAFRQAMSSPLSIHSAQARWFVGHTQPTPGHSLHPFRPWLQDYFRQSVEADSESNELAFRTVLSQLMDRTPIDSLREDLERTQGALAALIGLPLTDHRDARTSRPDRLESSFVALTSLVKAESLLQPVILCVEDIHWLDRDSWHFLQQLPLEVQAFPMAILLTAKPELTLPDPHWSGPITMMELSALSEADLSRLASDLYEDALPPRLLESLIARASGNPFFAKELLVYLAELGEFTNIRDIDTGSLLPTDVRALLTARLDQLPSEVVQIVQGAAVLGTEFDGVVLAQMFPDEPDLAGRMGAAEEAGIWFTAGRQRYQFRHTLVRDVAYEMQLHARRRELHQRALKAMETIFADDLVSLYHQLGYHAAQAGDEERERQYTLAAGREALARSANEEAVQYLDRALELTPATDRLTRYELLGSRAKANDGLGARDAQARDLAEMLLLAQDLGDKARQAEVIAAQADLAQATGNYATARRQFEASLDLARAGGHPPAERGALYGLGVTAFQQRRWRTAAYHLDQALAIARELKNPEWIGETLRQLGKIALQQGDLEQSAQYASESLQIYRELQDQHGISAMLSHLGDVARRQSRYEEAAAYHQESVSVARAAGDRRGIARSLISLGQLALLRLESANASRHYKEALAISQAIDAPDLSIGSLVGLGTVHATHGETASAHSHFLAGLQQAQSADLMSSQLKCVLAEAWLLAQEGQEKRAAEIAGLVQDHPALPVESREEFLLPLLARLRRSLGEQRLESALTRGRTFDLEAVVRELLAQPGETNIGDRITLQT